MSPRYSVSSGTRDRIVQAAGEVFGEQGFHSTTIRAITERAKVNVAAVNYHFKDKAELYLHVLRGAKCQADNFSFPNPQSPPEKRLRDFLSSFVHHLLDPARPAWHSQVLMQEMLHPTEAIEVLVKELIGPLYRELRGVIADVIGRSASREELDLATSSVLGQCLYYRRSRPLVERLAPGLLTHPERIAEHISSFTLAALQRTVPKKSKSPVSKPRNRTSLQR